MNHRPLGRTGVSVSHLCLGAMMFGAWGNPDHDESIRIIHTALDAGVTVIDTADVYAQGESEEIVGKALKGRRDDIILATKFHGAMGDDPNRQGSSRRWIIRAVEDSLRRLDTDWIDLYQVHRPRTDTDIDETLGALTDLVRQGKIRYLGASTFPASQIVEAQWVARDRGLQRFVTEQPAYSMLVRRIEDDILPTCQRHGMGVMSYSPLTGGWLSGRWRKDGGQQASSRASRLPERFDLSQPANQRKLDAVEAFALLADDTGISLIQMAIGWSSTTQGSPRPSSGRAPWISWRASSLPSRSCWNPCARPDRRDRRPRHDHQPGRQLLRQPRTRPGGTSALISASATSRRFSAHSTPSPSPMTKGRHPHGRTVRPDPPTGATRLYPIIGDPIRYVESPTRLTRTLPHAGTTGSASRCRCRKTTSRR